MGAGALTIETPMGMARRAAFPAAFEDRYNQSIRLENQPSDLTMACVTKLRARRTCDFVSLDKVSNAAEVRNAGLGPTRLRDTPFTIDPQFLPDNRQKGNKKTDRTQSPGSCSHAVRTMVLKYALVSAADEVGQVWRARDAANSHLAAVESMYRLNSRANHAPRGLTVGSELFIRLEWVEMHQTQPPLSLGGIITLVAPRRSVRPLRSEFRSFLRNDKKYGNPSRKHKGNGAQRRCYPTLPKPNPPLNFPGVGPSNPTIPESVAHCLAIKAMSPFADVLSS